MKSACLGGISALLLLLVGLAATAAGQAPLDRTVLPIAEPEPPLYTELDVRNATPPPRFEVRSC
jgi:arylsulfatase